MSRSSVGANDAATSAERRLASVVGGVVRAALRDARRTRVVVQAPDTPEGRLLLGWLRDLDHASAPTAETLVLDPANKTVAVLWPELIAAAPVLPLADLYATQVRDLAGGWSAPAQAREWIDAAGGIDVVDAFLIRHLDERHPLDEALAVIPDRRAAEAVAVRYQAGWWWRRRLGVVPKLGSRTLGIDLR